MRYAAPFYFGVYGVFIFTLYLFICLFYVYRFIATLVADVNAYLATVENTVKPMMMTVWDTNAAMVLCV